MFATRNTMHGAAWYRALSRAALRCERGLRHTRVAWLARQTSDCSTYNQATLR